MKRELCISVCIHRTVVVDMPEGERPSVSYVTAKSPELNELESFLNEKGWCEDEVEWVYE